MLRKKPNPRNIANAAKAEELERELERYVLRLMSSKDVSSNVYMHIERRANTRSYKLKQRAYTNQLCRLQLERRAWDEVAASADKALQSESQSLDTTNDGLSPLQPDLLSSPQRAILEQLNQPNDLAAINPSQIQQRLQDVATKLEYTVDSFAHSVHAVSTTRDVAERIAQQSSKMAARELEKREEEQAASSGGHKVDALDALRGLAKVLNARKR